MTGALILPAATTSLGPLRIPHGTAPTSPTNGDIWTTSAGLYARINGSTVGPYIASAGSYLSIANNLSDLASASTARTNLGLGTIATQAASSVAITGGSIAGITDLAVADGGTGSSTASGARTNLGLGTAATQNTGTSGANIPLLNANNTHSGNCTFSGTFTHSGSTATFNNDVVLGSSSADDITVNGTLAGNQFPSAWAECTIVAGSITSESGFNAAISTTGSTGILSVTFDSALASANYAVVASAQRTAGGGDAGMVSYYSRTTSGFTVRCETPGGSAFAPTSLSVVVFGPLA